MHMLFHFHVVGWNNVTKTKENTYKDYEINSYIIDLKLK